MEFVSMLKQMMTGDKFTSNRKTSKPPRQNKATQVQEVEFNNSTLRMAKLMGWEYLIKDNFLRFTPGVIDWLFKEPVGQISIDELSLSIHPLQRETFNKKVAHAISNGVGFEIEIKKYTADGKEKWLRIVCQTERKNGHTTKLSGIMQDITLQKKKEKRRIQQHLDVPYQLLQRSLWEHENELGRIAVEIHENISQVLIVARNYLQIDLIEFTPLGGKKERGIKIIEKAIRQLKELYERIEVPPLRLMGLEGSLTELIERYNKQTSTQLVLTAFDALIEEADDLIKLTLIRLTKELIKNVRVHSQASEAWVSLDMNENEIQLTVKDDGIGFYPYKTQWGTGLRRAEIMITSLGGLLELNSSPGKGCDALVTLPFSYRALRLD